MAQALADPIFRRPDPESTTEGTASRVVFSWTAPTVDLPGERQQSIAEAEERLVNFLEARLSEMSEEEQARAAIEISAIQVRDKTPER